ncbi:MAG: T9SS type A sorting domain-containing protein [Bacteroidota bacterium]
MKRILFFTLLVLALKANAQVYFDSTYKVAGSISSPSWSVIEDNDYFYLAGDYNTPGNLALNFCIRKLDAFGNKIWEKHYGDSINSYWVGWASMSKTHDSCFVVAVDYQEPALSQNTMCLVKFNQNGDTLWMRKYHTSYRIESAQVQMTPDKGFICVGATDSTDGYPHHDITLIKTDSLGYKKWQKFYHKTGNERAFSVETMDDEGYIIGGWCDEPIGKGLIYRTDSLGNLIYSHFYGSGWDNGGSAVKNLQDSTYAISYTFGYSNDGGATVHYKTRLAKLRNNNQLLWEKEYGPMTHAIIGYKIIEENNMNLSIIGNISDSASQHISGFILKTDSLGNQIFFRMYDHLTNASDQNYLYDFRKTSDNGYVAAGFCLGSGNPQQAWVIRVDSMGCQIPGCNVMVIELEEPTRNILIYPNPTNNQITIQTTQSKNSFILSIFNSIGKEVIKQNVNPQENEVKIDVSTLPPGIYFVKIQNYTGKFVKVNSE